MREIINWISRHTEEQFAFDVKLNQFHQMDRINQVMDLQENISNSRKSILSLFTNQESFQNRKDVVENDQLVNDDGLVSHVIVTW